MRQKEFPNVLIIAMGKINKIDNTNNGLLLRNLFINWPKENLAQVYTSVNSDKHNGFFSNYFELGINERRFGNFFFRNRSAELIEKNSISNSKNDLKYNYKIITNLFFFVKQLLFETGLYEIIFKIKVSKELSLWVQNFKPTHIFVQGYSLGMIDLALKIANITNCPIIYYPTDDWVISLYSHRRTKFKIIAFLVNKYVAYRTSDLVKKTKVCIAFNHFMKTEYYKRYNKNFEVLMHGDNLERYIGVNSKVNTDFYPLIISTGQFDEFRFSLIKDAEIACHDLSNKGFKPMLFVYSVNIDDELIHQVSKFKFVKLLHCPSHDELKYHLGMADILFLPERFGSEVWDIKLSISSKAHLFMFCNKPILVYSSKDSGIAQYVLMEKWGLLLDKRDPIMLSNYFENIILNKENVKELLENCKSTISKNHLLPNIQSSFLRLLKE